jgi:hypothetical protein
VKRVRSTGRACRHELCAAPSLAHDWQAIRGCQVQGGMHQSWGRWGPNRMGLIGRVFSWSHNFWSLASPPWKMAFSVHSLVPVSNEVLKNVRLISVKKNGSSSQSFLPFICRSNCATCGRQFDVPICRGRGRPQRFCSDSCRTERVRVQKREWAVRQREKPGREGMI